MAAEQARQDAAMVHLGRGLEHVRIAQQWLGGAPSPTARSRSARAWRELNAASSQFETVTQILDGRLPVEEAAVADVVELPAVRSAVSEAHRLVAERRVIVNLGYPEGLAVLAAIDATLQAGIVKRSTRDRLVRVLAVLEPRVARARRARRQVAA